MKTKIVFTSVLIIGASIVAMASNPHAWSGEKQRLVWKNWSVSANAGITSYFGDLSYYDLKIPGKLKYESEPAFSFMLNKQFSSAFGVAGQILYGGLTNENKNVADFNTSFLEYNLQGRLNLVEAFNGERIARFGFIAFAGIGQFLFRTVDYSYDSDGVSEMVHETGVPEFVYFAGGEVRYLVNERIGININLAVRQAQNDKLDNVVAGSNFDYYSYASIGLTYRFIDLFGTHKTPNLTRTDFPYGFR